ncbi:hypothetical protein GALL_103180 [mine drainage metagenome]|uniref:Uncharacterized protein n=1 Tax=mine drainage metagenome TaxID=410659 RepID=A0A1J5SUF4_9ZZZZ
MLSVSLIEFINYSQSDFLEYLTIESETHFKIIYPKLFISPTDLNAQIHNNYIMAAYAGHQLSAISTNFSYYVPAPEIFEDFYFMLQTENMESLSGVLYSAIDYMIFKDLNHFNKIFNELTLFYNKVDAGTIKSTTMGIYEIANKFYIE